MTTSDIYVLKGHIETERQKNFFRKLRDILRDTGLLGALGISRVAKFSPSLYGPHMRLSVLAVVVGPLGDGEGLARDSSAGNRVSGVLLSSCRSTHHPWPALRPSGLRRVWAAEEGEGGGAFFSSWAVCF